AVGRAHRGEGVHLVGVANRGADAGVAEGAAGTVVVAEHLHGQVSRRAGGGGGPAVGQVEAFPAEDAPDVGLGGGPVHVPLGPPVVLGDADLGPGVVAIPPPLHQVDQVHLAAVDSRAGDPALIDVIGVPQAARGAVAQ